MAAAIRVRIVAEHRGAYRALDGAGRTAWVELTGKQFHTATDKRELPTVGDWVRVDRWEEAVADQGAGVVREIDPRNSLLVRKAAGEATVPQPIAANIDVGFVLTSANSDLSLPRLDRYITLLRDGGIRPVLVLSKIDLVADPSSMIAQLSTIADVPVISVSAQAARGLDSIRVYGGPGKTCVLLGSSGVGKSTLLNALIGTRQEVREIRADERGKHTTTHRELFVAADGGMWVDTPGMRELAQWVDEEEPEAPEAFDDIRDLAHQCRFRDCTHEREPGCAVREAVTPERLASFHKLANERVTAAERQAKAEKLAAHRKARQRAPKPRDE